jgi:hypothetical protein
MSPVKEWPIASIDRLTCEPARTRDLINGEMIVRSDHWWHSY